MARPILDPDCICMQLVPGDRTRAVTSLTSTPRAARFVPKIRNGGALVRVRETVVFRVFTRPLTEEEIAELPPFPPSIRENARRNKRVEEREEFQRVQGESPVEVEAGQIIEINIEFSVAPQTLEGITAATLVVESSAWETTEVPIFCVVGRASAVPVVVPDKIRAALAPGETTSHVVMIPAAPSGDSLVACVINGGGVIRLKQVIAFASVRREFTEEEIAELPPFPPSIRENARREGYFEQVERGRSSGAQSLPVAAGQMVQVYLDFTAPQTGFTNITEAALVIDSPRWQRTEIPLRLIIGRIQVELSSGPVSISQGGTADIVVSVASLAGPGDDVHFSLEGDGDKIQIVPAKLSVNPRQRAVAQLTLFADDDTPVGLMPVTFEARVFEQIQVHRVPLQLNMSPGSLKVGTRPFSITTKQGDTVTFEVFANSEGAAKNMTFTPGSLPEGVRVEPVNFPVGPGRASQIRPVRMFIDRNAPTTDQAWTPIFWSANNGIHGGILNLPLTIELNPDERVFRQQITTPAGTALGGFAEVVIRNDGTYTFRGHMHGSGFDPYDFRVGFFLSTPAITLADTFSSRVGGAIGGGPRDRDWDRPGRNDMIREHWAIVSNAICTFNKWYENTGVLGGLEEFVVTVGEFLLIRALAGPAAAAVLLLGPELAQMVDLPVTRPHRIPGSIILSGVVMLFGPLAAVPAVVAGIGVAKAEDVRSRRMHQSEVDEAKKIFGDTLPIDRIRVTNLLKYGGPGGVTKAFCEFNPIDETIILGMGSVFDTEITSDPVFIHELTHAWQWAHNAFSPAKMWGAIERVFMSAEEEAELYRIYGDGRPWRDFHSEGQARVVELWYSMFRGDLNSDAARNNIFFRYIANHIRMGNP